MEHEERLKAALADRYQIEREIGSGGMATVFLAEDLKHDRRVAVKVLRPELAAVIGAERFLNEIRVTAHLQHPHILPLFDSGEADGFLYYVMPYVEGESLRERLRREKQLPLEAAIQITKEATSALDYAHRHGVIHRDIKPGNILLHDGQALVADFGIALAVTAAGGDRITETGLSLGTPEYMSPEQATGDRELDARSDIYSIGAVLYEMLAGDPPHTGPTVQAIIVKLVTERPRPVRELRDTVPIHVEVALDRALARLPADRFATASDFADALTGKIRVLGAADSLGDAVTIPSKRGVAIRGWRVTLPWAVAIVALAVAVWSLLQPAVGPQPVARYEIRLPDAAPLAFVGSAPLAVPRPSLAVSPDGSQVVYVAESEGDTQLFLRSLDRYEVAGIPGTEGAYDPFFSPDGQWIGFFASGELRKVSLAGGQVVSLAPVRNSYGATWVSDDRIVFSVQDGTRLEAVPATGGGVEAVEIATSDISYFFWPEALPGGEAVLVSNHLGTMSTVSLATGAQTFLGVPGKNPRYLASGHLVYAGTEGLQAIGFDLDRMALVGQPVPVPVPVRVEPVWGTVHADISENGTLVYAAGRGTAVAQFQWRAIDGTSEWLDLEPRPYENYSLSADGTRLAFTLREQALPNIFVYDLLRGSLERLTKDGAYFPIWMPDGRALAYGEMTESGDYGSAVLVTQVGGTRSDRLFEGPNSLILDSRWSSDGNRLAVWTSDPDSSFDVWVAERTDRWTLHPLATTRFAEWGGAISPDGRWVAYTSDETGEYRVYVRPFPPTEERFTISTEAYSEEPVWSYDGTELYYRNGRRWMRVRIRHEPTFSAGQPEFLFAGDYINLAGRSYDVAPDGCFLLLAAPEEPNSRSRLRVVTNWVGEVERLVREGGR